MGIANVNRQYTFTLLAKKNLVDIYVCFLISLLLIFFIVQRFKIEEGNLDEIYWKAKDESGCRPIA